MISKVALVVSGVVAVITVFSGVFLYNGVVQLRNANQENSELLTWAELKNADLKSDFYNLLDFSSLDQLAQSLNLVKEQNPDYLKVGGLQVSARN